VSSQIALRGSWDATRHEFTHGTSEPPE